MTAQRFTKPELLRQTWPLSLIFDNLVVAPRKKFSADASKRWVDVLGSDVDLRVEIKVLGYSPARIEGQAF